MKKQTAAPAAKKRPSSPKQSKRDAILDAMLDIVVEQGFHEAPMSLVSERSGASPGVIYHHFASKEDILQALYERICHLKHQSLFQGYAPGMDAREAFIRLGRNWYHFYRKHLREMRFLEQYEMAGFPCKAGATAPSKEEALFRKQFSGQSKGGVLKDWPEEVIEEMTIGVLSRLAKQPRKLSDDLLRELAESAWEAVKAHA